MDKTIEIVIVAMVVLIAATIVLFLVQDRTTSFEGFLDNQQSGAKCDLLKARDNCDEFRAQSCSGTCQSNSQESQNSVPDCPEGYRPASGGCVAEGSGAGL